MTTLDEALASVKAECEFAFERFGKFNSAHEGYAVILEEFDEMWDEVKNNNLFDARLEAIQVAAMAVRFLVEIE